MGCIIRLFLALLVISVLVTFMIAPELWRPHKWIIATFDFYASTRFKKSVDDFTTQWCRLQKWRVDWERMIRPCVGKMSWDSRDVMSRDRTSAYKSYVTEWQLSPAGEFSRFFIQSVTSQGLLKTFGGDSWRIRIRQGPSSLAPVVFDLDNGLYEVLFLVLEPGSYNATIVLDHTLCDGYRDPPEKYFKYGTACGNYRHENKSFLGYLGRDYINKPLQGLTSVPFTVPLPYRNTGIFKHCQTFEEGECKSLDFSCDMKCNLMWDGHGRWFQNLTWKPYLKAPSVAYTKPTSFHGDVMHALGDSNARRFMDLATTRDLCKTIFRKCKLTTNWVYEVKVRHISDEFDPDILLDQFRTLLGSKDMSSNGSVFLFNMGIHYSLAINFTSYQKLLQSVIKLLQETEKDGVTLRYRSVPIWRGTTMIEREKLITKPWPNRLHNSTLFRFHTNQRTQLYHTYAMQAMCRAGIRIIDTYPLTGSYPRGTYDNVHYDLNVFAPVFNLLETYFPRVKKRKKT